MVAVVVVLSHARSASVARADDPPTDEEKKKKDEIKRIHAKAICAAMAKFAYQATVNDVTTGCLSGYVRVMTTVDPCQELFQQQDAKGKLKGYVGKPRSFTCTKCEERAGTAPCGTETTIAYTEKAIKEDDGTNTVEITQPVYMSMKYDGSIKRATLVNELGTGSEEDGAIVTGVATMTYTFVDIALKHPYHFNGESFEAGTFACQISHKGEAWAGTTPVGRACSQQVTQFNGAPRVEKAPDCPPPKSDK
jgi:hypothetical protein